MIPHSLSGTSLTFFAKGKMWSVSADHPNYDQIRSELILSRTGENTLDVDGIISLYDKRFALVSASKGKLVILGDQLVYNGEVISNAWANRIKTSQAEGKPFQAVFKALEDLMENPSSLAKERLPPYMENSLLGFLPDGRVTAFLVVREDYRDVRGIEYQYRVGATPTADERGELLVGAAGYIKHKTKYDFSLMPPDRKILLVAFWPRHVKCANGLKLQVSEFQVLDEIDPARIDEFVRENGHLVRGYVDELPEADASEGTTPDRVATAPLQRERARRQRTRRAA